MASHILLDKYSNEILQYGTIEELKKTVIYTIQEEIRKNKLSTKFDSVDKLPQKYLFDIPSDDKENYIPYCIYYVDSYETEFAGGKFGLEVHFNKKEPDKSVFYIVA